MASRKAMARKRRAIFIAQDLLAWGIALSALLLLFYVVDILLEGGL